MTAFFQVPTSMYGYDFARLSPDAQRLEWYLRTNPHRASEGLYRLPFGYIEEDIGMDRGTATQAMKELITARPFLYDFQVGVVLDVYALRDNPLKNGVDKVTGEIRPDNRLKGAISKLKALPPTVLLHKLLTIADNDSPDLAQEMRLALPNIEETRSLQAPSKEHTEAPRQAPIRGEPTGGEEQRVDREESRSEGSVVDLIKSSFNAEVVSQ